jgi:hypothetical protein
MNQFQTLFDDHKNYFNTNISKSSPQKLHHIDGWHEY